MAYKYRCLVLTCKTPRRSLRQLDETRLNKEILQLLFAVLLISSVLKIFKKIWCDSYGQFFHAGCLDIPFTETWGGQRHQHNILPVVRFES